MTDNHINIFRNRDLVISASRYIHTHQEAFIDYYARTNYYNVNGIVWEIWDDGCGNFPTSEGFKVEDFKLLKTTK